MQLLLDTNICVYIIKHKPENVLQQFSKYQPTDIAISTITVYELMYGVYKSQQVEKNLVALSNFLKPLELLDFTSDDAQVCGAIRAQLEKQGKMIGPLDIQIAAQALSHDLLLVSNNTKEFERIADLKLENWV
jgi:tRNA(fMet)-specific endonuclease VapC